jgi:hypothetical protein
VAECPYIRQGADALEKGCPRTNLRADTVVFLIGRG